MSTPVSLSRLRWWLCGLLFVATALSFLDRQVLSVLAPVITEQLGISNQEYGYVTTAFLISYAIMFLGGGRLMDVVGTQLGMALSVGLWSVASGLHAVAQNAFQLGFFRFVLGVGEGGCFPGAAKGVTEWFPAEKRALAIGIANGGSAFGAVLAPPLAVWLANIVTWRGAFVATGVIGVIWVVAWWWLSRGVRTHRTGAVAPVLDATVGSTPPSLPEERPALLTLLGRLDVWGLALMRFIFDPVFYFYMFWIPKYLSAERGASQQQIGELTWIPFLALGVSNALGGWASDALIRRGLSAMAARKTVMAAAAVVTMASGLTGLVKTVEMALAMMSLLMFAHGFWITNYIALISDRFPKTAVGTVVGFAGTVGATGGILANTSTGWIVDRFSYGPLWLASGFIYPLAFAVLMLTIRARKT
ncbi:MAG: MFS transporter [Verrucomicrobiae bacterium]|nr:MFS transporter [Verrucomicrobiae bacterium]